MRIYNNKTAQMEFDLTNVTRLVIPGKSVSKNFMPNTNFINMLVQAYSTADFCFIVSNASEYNLCATTLSATPQYMVGSIEEAFERFGVEVAEKKEQQPVEKEKVIETAPEPVKEEKVEETVTEASQTDENEVKNDVVAEEEKTDAIDEITSKKKKSRR